MINARRWIAGGLVALAVLTVTSACSSSKPKSDAQGTQLVGLFQLTGGAMRGTQLTGTWFRMLEPNGKVGTGQYMINANSAADGGRATLLQPGVAGGLRTAGYQSQPASAFDAGGNSLADSIVAPTKFFGVKFSISTNEVDPQTKTEVPPPTVYLKDGKLTADLAAWAASWNKQNFNQGAPKPVSSTGAKADGQQQVEKVFDFVSRKYLAAAPKPTVTGSGATGTYDPKTGAFTLQWTSLIAGGPFNGFTGLWHLEGVFKPGTAGPSGS